MKRTLTVRSISNHQGFTIIEVLIAALITAILATASFHFYTTMHAQSETQYDVSEMQHLARSSLYDIRMTLVQAGFKIPASHPAFEVSGDTLSVYYSETQPIDTIKYYLDEFSPSDYALIPDLPAGTKLYRLIKQVNSDAPAEFADYVSDFTVNQLDSANVQVTINIQASRSDDSYSINNGFRIYTLSERINVRNMS